LSTIFMVVKSFPRKPVRMKKNFEKIFWLKIFYGCKIISSKTGLNEKKILRKRFGQEFLWFQNHFFENRLA